MANLVIAVAALLATHFGLSSSSLRGMLVERIGLGMFRALYSTIAVACFVWIAIAYRSAPYEPLLWYSPLLGWAPVVLMPLALLLVVAGATQPNPTSVGQGEEKLVAEPRGALRITRHPVMWGIATWALAHVLANGELKSLILFGGLAALALVGTVVLDAKNTAKAPEAYATFRARTSSVPLAAVIAGRQSLAAGLSEIGWPRLSVAAALYVILIGLHPYVFGVPAHPV